MKNISKDIHIEKCIENSVVLLTIYLLLKYAVGILFPFAIALCVGAVVYPLSERMSKFSHLPRKLCATLLLLLFLAVIGSCLFWCSATLT